MSSEAPPSRLPRRLLTFSAALLVTLLTAAACTLTWDVLRTLAETGGIDHTWSAVYPAAADALLVLTLLSLLAARHARWWTRALRWTLLLLLLAGLSWTTVQHAVWGYASLPAKPLRGTVAVAPHAMLLIGVWLWLTTLRLLRTPTPRQRPTSPPTPAAPLHESPLEHLFPPAPTSDAPAERHPQHPAEHPVQFLSPPPEEHGPQTVTTPSAQDSPNHPAERATRPRAALQDHTGPHTQQAEAPHPDEPSQRTLATPPLAPYPTTALSSEPEIQPDTSTTRQHPQRRQVTVAAPRLHNEGARPPESPLDARADNAAAHPTPPPREDSTPPLTPSKDDGNTPLAVVPNAGTEARTPGHPPADTNAPQQPAEEPQAGAHAASEHASHSPGEDLHPNHPAHPKNAHTPTAPLPTNDTPPESPEAVDSAEASPHLAPPKDTPPEDEPQPLPSHEAPPTTPAPDPDPDPISPDREGRTAKNTPQPPRPKHAPLSTPLPDGEGHTAEATSQPLLAEHDPLPAPLPDVQLDEAQTDDTPPWGLNSPSSRLRSSPTPPAD